MHNSHVEMRHRIDWQKQQHGIYIEGLCTYTSLMPCNGMRGHVSVSQVLGWRCLPNEKLHVTTTTSIYWCLLYTEGAVAKSPLPQRCSNAETQDDEKLYEITLFSECAVIPFLQESYRLKYLSKMACSEANRWSFETHRRHENDFFINNLAYIAHHKHAYILSTNREREGEREREKEGEGWEDYAVQKKIKKCTKWTCLFFFSFFSFSKIPTTRGQEKQDRLQTRNTNKKYRTRVSIFSTRTEQRQMQGERNIRQLHSSHIKGVFIFKVDYSSGSIVIIFMAVWAAQMSDSQLNTDSESTGRLDIDYAWLGQFVWAVVYKPFRAQSIGIYKMMNVYGGWDAEGDLVSERTSLTQ